jgi:hypothetical protein
MASVIDRSMQTVGGAFLATVESHGEAPAIFDTGPSPLAIHADDTHIWPGRPSRCLPEIVRTPQLRQSA